MKSSANVETYVEAVLKYNCFFLMKPHSVHSLLHVLNLTGDHQLLSPLSRHLPPLLRSVPIGISRQPGEYQPPQ
jgi:hypothetical protein